MDRVMNKHEAFIDQLIKTGGILDAVKATGRYIGNSATEAAAHVANFARNPLAVGGHNIKSMMFDGMKPGAGLLEKAMFNPLTQAFFLGYLPAASLYSIYNSDSKHKGEAYGAWLGSQAAMAAVPMTAGFGASMLTNTGLAMAGAKAGELLDNYMRKKDPKEPAQRTEDRINAQLPQSQLPVY